jgi:2-phospho-L-lactate guanylyltransferase
MTTSPGLATDPTVLIPLRADGKHRLCPVLDPDERWLLALAMLDDVVAALRAAGVRDMRILADGAAAIEASRRRDLQVIVDRHGSPEADDSSGTLALRRAVDDGLAACGRDRVRTVVAADLPLLTGDDVLALLATSDRLTVAPTRDGGTGALLLPMGHVIESRFGRGSAVAHLEAARERDVEIVRLDRTGFAIDLDTAVDLDAIAAIARMGTAPGGARCGQHTAAALAELGLLDVPLSRARVATPAA